MYCKVTKVFRVLSFLAVLCVVLALSACSSSESSVTPSNLSGKWVGNTTQSGVQIQVILNLVDSSGALSGTMEVGTRGFTSPLGNLQGTRSGDQVSIRPPLSSSFYSGTLSGNRISFERFAAYQSVTFVKQ
jgi:uncharacterized lipoprotein